MWIMYLVARICTIFLKNICYEVAYKFEIRPTENKTNGRNGQRSWQGWNEYLLIIPKVLSWELDVQCQRHLVVERKIKIGIFIYASKQL